MNVRNILVAASAAAILAGSSYGALAYQAKGFSKGESGSVIVVYSTANTYGQKSDVIIFGYGEQDAISKNGGGPASAGSATWGAGGSSQTTWSNATSGSGPQSAGSPGQTLNGSTYATSSNGQSSSSWAAGGTSGFASAGGGGPY